MAGEPPKVHIGICRQRIEQAMRDDEMGRMRLAVASKRQDIDESARASSAAEGQVPRCQPQLQ
eukprot:7717184-Heterocapsa_arctica.AAC.1